MGGGVAGDDLVNAGVVAVVVCGCNIGGCGVVVVCGCVMQCGGGVLVCNGD